MPTNSTPNRREYDTPDVSEEEWGSDFIADLLKAYGFEYVFFNPGASFRGIEESIINYNDNNPSVIETLHEGLSVSMAHGYAKATGEPALCILHNVVGTMHGAMSIFNAYADSVPLLILSGSGPSRKSKRRPWIDWVHTANIQGNLVREFVKWDDEPDAIDGVAESIIRAHRVANTPPKGPTYVALDHEVQECALETPMEIPPLEKFERPSKMAPDHDSVSKAAAMLLEAELPVILVDQVGDSRNAVEALVELAETLGAPIVDVSRRRFNVPNTHPLDLTGTGIFKEADLLLAVDVWSVDQVTKDASDQYGSYSVMKNEYDIIEVGTDDLEISSLTADYYSLQEHAVSILSESEVAVPALTEAITERLQSGSSAKRVEERRTTLAERHDRQRREWREEAERQWEETPISIPRLTGEIWEVIRDDSWVIVNGRLRQWPFKLWEIEEFDQYIGGDSGGSGVGYGIGAAIGGALAYSDTERIPINLQSDGDLMFYLNGLWTLGHYEIPMLTVVHNNKSLYNSTAHRMRLADYRGRDSSYERALIGTSIHDPTPDYASIAESMGVNGYGPIEEPDNLKPALEAAWEDVKTGRPALIDVVSQPR